MVFLLHDYVEKPEYQDSVPTTPYGQQRPPDCYNAGVEEQQVMERTGHRSLDGVRRYKPTSMKQKEALSNILNCHNKNSTTPSGDNYRKLDYTILQYLPVLNHWTRAGCTHPTKS